MNRARLSLTKKLRDQSYLLYREYLDANECKQVAKELETKGYRAKVVKSFSSDIYSGCSYALYWREL